MNLTFEKIQIQNFLSFGNIPQVINLNDKSYQVILGYNKDKSSAMFQQINNSVDDSISSLLNNTDYKDIMNAESDTNFSESDKNGVGKSSIFEAIHYALFGKSIGNKVTLGNLINNINKKNMLVTLTFKKDDIEYSIVRGRSPSVLKFLKNGNDIISDESQGDSRETQKEIEKVLGMNEDIFDQIVCLSCKVPVFLDQSTSNQKNIIEKILGIDVISKKVDLLKSLIKETKNELNCEQFKVNTVKAQNDNLTASIEKQISDMNQAKILWKKDLEKKISDAETILKQVDENFLNNEILNFKALEEYNLKNQTNIKNIEVRNHILKTIENEQNKINSLTNNIKKLTSFDFTTEKANQTYNADLRLKEEQYIKDELVNRANKAELEREKDNFFNISSNIDRKKSELSNIKSDICPVCGGKIDEKTTEALKSNISNEIQKLQEQMHKSDLKIMELNHEVLSFKEQTFEYKDVTYESLNEVLNQEGMINTLKKELTAETNLLDENNEQLKKIVVYDLGEKPSCSFKSMEEIMNFKSYLETAKNNLQTYNEQIKMNPFEQQEKSIENLKKTIVEVDETVLNNLTNSLSDQELLLKLLNSPSSFIRKTILDKSLEFLNNRITLYLAKLGSLHSVLFNNDMSINISYMGMEYGYVSSGEMGRISVALTLAFRDVWESLNDCSVNLLAMDEVIDRIGLDTAGVEMMVSELESKTGKNIMLVTHNEVLIRQSPELLTLVKEKGFTSVVK